MQGQTRGAEPELLPNFDRRLEGGAGVVGATPLTMRNASAVNRSLPGETALRAVTRNVRVDRDPVTGAPAFIGAPDGFLTGPDGSGRTLSAARLSRLSPGDPHRVVKAFIDEYSGLFGHGSGVLDAARVARDYVTPHNGLRTVDWEQYLDDIRIFEAGFQAHLTARGELVNVASHLVSNAAQAVERGAPSRAERIASPTVSAQDAVTIAATWVGAETPAESLILDTSATGPDARQLFHGPTLLDADVRYVWLPTDATTLRLCWQVICTTKSDKFMYRLLIDAETGTVQLRQSLTEHMSNASYRVFTSDSPSPFSPGLAVPSSFQPPLVSRTLVTTSALDATASPNGWIDDGVMETRGNNVDAHTDLNADNLPDLPRPQAVGAERVFDPALDLTQDPSTYRDAAVVNLFYWCNFMHDKLYALGFTEAAGNFQNLNFGNGGIGNDAVQADAQDGSGTNNANFSTPPDGSPGRMQMYVFTGSSPKRDGDFDAEIILHEYTHGLSNRLVGGGVGISALQTRGMGEGWSDFYALSLLSDPADDVNGNYGAGAYASYQLAGLNQNYYFGIRRYPYTTDIKKNPLTLRDIDPDQASSHVGVPISPIIGPTANEVHNMGEVWCITLWDARAKLINKYGAAAGNQLMLQLTTDGMKLSPANPNFLQARDAIIQADLVNNAGANRLELWSAFAKRGMGASAFSPASSTTTGIIEAFDLPDDLAVSPVKPWAVTATVGGPYPTQTYTLTNTGSAALSWTATTQPWLSLDLAAGTIAPGESASVTASFTSAALRSAGVYNATMTFTDLTSGRNVARVITLSLQPPVIVAFPLDSDTGWTRTGEWAFGHPTGGGGVTRGFHDPSNGATGANVFGINLNGDYATTVAPAAYLTTGPYDLTGYANTRLQFQRWLNADYSAAQTVEVSRNGTTWTKIWDNGPTSTGVIMPVTSNAWTKVQYDISAIADNQPTVYVRWGHQVMFGGASPYSGWNIDDVELLGQTGAAAPVITVQPVSQKATVGDTVVFSVSATGLPAPVYQWNFNGAPISGATSATLTLSNVQVSNAGAYSVTLKNSLGSVTSTAATLSGSAQIPTIVTPPVNVVARSGGATTLSVVASSTEPLTYQWRRNGFVIPGATNANLILFPVSRTDSDYYDVVVAAGLSAVSSPVVRVSVAPTAYVASVAPDPAWNLQLESYGGIGYVVTPLSDGRCYIAGSFTSLNGVHRPSIVRFNPDGVTLDPTFSSPEIDNTVRRLAVQPDGKVIILGDFIRVNGLLRPKLARLNADGSLDLGFAPATTADASLSTMGVQGDGRILIGGYFFNYDGTNRNYLVRLNPDGSLDSSFLTLGTTNRISALALQSDGRIMIAGYFDGYVDVDGRTTKRPNLARLNSDGTLDTTFLAPALPNSDISAVAPQSDGKVVVAGYLSAVGSIPTGNIARFNADGSFDAAFTASSGAGFNSSVNAALVQSDGRILVGGYFSTYAGSAASSLARLNSDGTRDTTFLTRGLSYGVHGLALRSNGQILASGSFSSYLSSTNQSTACSLMAQLNSDGTLAAGANFSTRTWGSVNTLVSDLRGKLLVGGAFTAARGRSATPNLLRVNFDGSTDSTFNPSGSGPNSNVTNAAAQADGKILITGYFSSYNGVNTPGIARLNTDGTLDPTFNVGTGASGINVLTPLSGGRVFVGGFFTTASGQPRGRVAVFDPSGALDPNFAAGAGANGTVFDSSLQPDGKILIVGSFTTYDGVPANRIARLNPDGTLDPSFTTGTGFDSGVNTIALQPDGKVLVGGYFGTYNGAYRGTLVRLNSDGTLDPTFNPSTSGFVSRVLVQEDGRVVLLGSFYLASSATRSTLLRLNSNGSVDASFAAGGFAYSGSTPAALVMRDNGQLAVPSSGASSFTMTQNASAPAIASSPSNRSVTAGDTATFTVSATALGLPLSYQWLFNGVAVPGATSSSLALADVRVKQAGSYRVVVKNELGSAMSAVATLAVAKGQATIVLDGLAQTFDGTPRPVTVTTAPAGLPLTVTYDGNAAAPMHAGSYAVTATVVDPSFDGSAVGTLKVAKATASVAVETKSVVYDGSQKSVNATTSPESLYLNITYGGIAGSPTNAGQYAVKAEVVDPDYSGVGNGALTITPATASITLGALHPTYDGTPKAATVVTLPAGLLVTTTYDGHATAPTDAGSYAVAASISDSNYVGATTGTLTIVPASATITLSGLTALYDGTAKPVTVSTIPSGLVTQVTYNGNATAPTYPGSYAVTATINDPNYAATASDTLSILVTALVRHAPNLNGGIDGSIQVLLPDNIVFNSGAWISGDLLLPGEPSLLFNGNPILAGTLDAGGNPEPSDYQVLLNDGATLRYFVSGVDPITLPSVAAPPAPSGTRNVSLTRAVERVGSFATLRDLTVSGSASSVVVPAGTYGAFTARDGGGFALGIEGSTTPQVYNLQSLLLGNNSRLVLRGPVVINLANGASIQASAGDAAHLSWLTIKVASGGLTVNGNVTFHGFVVVPSGTVTINGGATLNGVVISDGLSINGNGVLSTPAP